MEIWHKRYGHLNEKDLGILTSKEIVQGIRMKPGKKMSVCEVCTQGKQSATLFPKTSLVRDYELLQFIHSDVCGPIKTKSIGGALYFATFIDEKSK